MIIDDLLKPIGLNTFDYKTKKADKELIEKYRKYYNGKVIKENDEVMLLDVLVKAFDSRLINSTRFASTHSQINDFKKYLDDMKLITPVAVKKSEADVFKKVIDTIEKIDNKKIVKLKYSGEEIRCFTFEKALKDRIENTRYGKGSYSLDFKFMDVHYHIQTKVPEGFEEFIDPVLREFDTFFIRDEKKIVTEITDVESEINDFTSVYIYTFPLRENKSEYLAQHKEMYSIENKIPKTQEEIELYTSVIRATTNVAQNIKDKAIWVLEENIDFQILDELLLSEKLKLTYEENNVVENIIYWKKGFLDNKDLTIKFLN